MWTPAPPLLSRTGRSRLFQVSFAREHVLFITVEFPVQPREDFVQFGDACNDLLALLLKQLLACGDGRAALMEQAHILDERFDGNARRVCI